jgi:pimeloyl-ACP methyl ester carboxylesterase
MRRGVVAVVVALIAVVAGSQAPPSHADSRGLVRVWSVHYRSHNGAARRAYVLLPKWYGPGNDPAIPLVISPHGRGVSAYANLQLWGGLPAEGTFAVISPQGQGRKLARYSWGSAGQIDDLARMPKIAHLTLPWLHIDRTRIYAVGGSMGGQETLLLLGKHPHLLAGAAALDSVTNLAAQYRRFPRLPCDRQCLRTWNGPIGRSLQNLARVEIGGTPKARAAAFAERSPLTYARAIAFSCVPLELWWSTKDRIVADGGGQSGAFYQRLLKLNPNANVAAFVGTWRHSREMHAGARLPAVLAWLGLLPPVQSPTSGLHAYGADDSASCNPG